MDNKTVTPSTLHMFKDLVSTQEQGITSRVLATTSGGNMTLFAFDKGQKISEHSAPFDALVIVQEGKIQLTIDGKPVIAVPESLVRMPANIPHALEALEVSRMLLVLLKEPKDK